MALVAGVDSSTQSCKVVIRDADDGPAGPTQGSRPHPAGTEVDPEAWWRALAGRGHRRRWPRRRRGALGRRPAARHGRASTPRARCPARRCSGTTPGRRRPPRTWSPSSGTGTRRRCRRWAEAVGTVPVASFTVDQAALAGRPRARACRPGGRGRAPPRLADLAAVGRRVARRARHRPLRRLGHRLLRPRSGDYRRDLLALALRRDEVDVRRIVLPRVLGPSERGRARATHRSAGPPRLGPGCGDNAGAALGLGLRPGETTVSIGTSGVVAAVSRHHHARPQRARGGLRRRHRALPAAGVHPQRRAGPRRHRSPARCGPRRAVPARPCRASRAPAGWSTCPTSRASARPTCRDATGSLHGHDARVDDAGRTWPGRPSRVCSASWPMAMEAVRAPRRAHRPGHARRWRSPVARPCARSRPRSSVCRSKCPTPGEYVADGAARQAAWVLSGAAEPPKWQPGQVATFEAEATPTVLERYREAAREVAGSSQLR